jgi:hypothetical protein
MPADGMSAAGKKRDFGTSRRQLSHQCTAPTCTRGRGDVSSWPYRVISPPRPRGIFKEA